MYSLVVMDDQLVHEFLEDLMEDPRQIIDELKKRIKKSQTILEEKKEEDKGLRGGLFGGGGKN